MYRINDNIMLDKNFFSAKKEILMKIKHLTTDDVEKVFKKVKEALEVSQHMLQCN